MIRVPASRATQNSRGAITDFIGVYGTPGATGPQSFIVRMPPGGKINPHFHRVDQFQVIVEGGGKLGRHAVMPVVAHYTDSFTPYGPINADEEGIGFFTLRRVTDPTDAHWMPDQKDDLERKGHRNVSAVCDLRDLENAESVYSTPGFHHLIPMHEDGMGMMLLNLRPGESAGDWQLPEEAERFALVMAGGLQDAEELLPVKTCIFLDLGESLTLTAGDEGASILLLQFPQRTEHP